MSVVPGEACVLCPNTSSVCTGGVVETHAAPGFWLYQAPLADSTVSNSTSAAVQFLQCTPVDACGESNVCVAGYEGDLVRALPFAAAPRAAGAGICAHALVTR